MSHSKQQVGFGLVELMIALALGLVIILGVTNLFVDSSRTLGDISRSGRQLENSLFAMDILASDLALIGYWGEANYPVLANDATFGPLRVSEAGTVDPPNSPMSDNFCPGRGAGSESARVELGWAMEYPVVTSSAGDARVLNCTDAAPAPKPTEHAVAIRRASTCSVLPSSSDCPIDSAGGFHLQVNGCNDINAGVSGGELKLYWVTQATIEALLPYRSFKCGRGLEASESALAPVYRYVSRMYYISVDDELIRLDLVGGEYHYEVLAQGIEALRFEWLIDQSNAGDYDVILSSEEEISPAELQDVVGVKIWMIVKSDTPTTTLEGSTITYVLGSSNFEVSDPFPRLLRARTVDLINISGRRR